MIADTVARVRENIRKVIVGKDEVIDLVLVALLCEGHVLLDRDMAEAEAKRPDLVRLAEKIRSDVRVAVKRQASFKTITRAVIAHRRTSSRACVLQ